MNQNTISCPKCGTVIDINRSLYTKLEAELQKKLENEVNEHRKKYKEAMETLKKKEHSIKEQEAQMAEKIKAATQEALKKERTHLYDEIKKEINEEQNRQMQLLQKELEAKSAQVKELNETKAKILQLQREKEELASTIKLEAQQQMSQKLKEEREKIAKAAAAENEMKLKEKDEQMQQIKRQLEEMKRKAEQGSTQIQGEAQEVAIEEWLSMRYPLDTIEEIKKGARGADCLQIVNTRELQGCGTIYYESKRTKEFQPSWIEKFKADIREKGADIGILVTTVLPKDMERMGQKDGIWICTYEEFKALSAILREQVIRVSHAMRSQENRSDKMGLLYNYLTSNEFKMQIEAIVEGFTQMQEDLQKEKNAMARIWKQREKQIMKVLDNTTAMYGSIRGIAGNAIGHIDALELPYFDEED
jgi:hypothetical protein